MKRILLLAGFIFAAGCESAPENIPGKEPLFVTDDCALIGAIGRERYDLSRDDPPMTIRLNGEDAPWTPSCDWQTVGFNLVEVRGPEGEAATPNMSRLTFNRPRYDDKGALIRTSLTANGETTAVTLRQLLGERQDVGPEMMLVGGRHDVMQHAVFLKQWQAGEARGGVLGQGSHQREEKLPELLLVNCGGELFQ